ncbi:MAG: pimeloyl-ACP methyl ester esterase BioH [Gammaproteobacteria bacterium]|nr:pimeloyl-ACP methyl ester esterase BioH [Gammaproteobacteria bacterium]
MRDSVTCIFVHGWAMNSAVWDACIAQLPDWINVVVVDLPGHGTMANVAVNTLDDYVQALVPLTHQPVVWVGWSLGGLAVLRLAELYPQRVASAMLVATNPCFVKKQGWSSAVEADVFNQFADYLSVNQKKTINRFLALQVKGSPDMKQSLKQLQQSIESRGPASLPALMSGLDILLNTDLRTTLKNLDCSLHWVFGANDSLVPKELAAILQQEYMQKDVTLLKQASHAPFISHSESFINQLIAIASQQRNSAF